MLLPTRTSGSQAGAVNWHSYRRIVEHRGSGSTLHKATAAAATAALAKQDTTIAQENV